MARLPDVDAQQDPAETAAVPTRPAQGRRRQGLVELAMRYPLTLRALGIHAVYRATGGGLIASGLSYATLFALIPTLALVVAGLSWLVGDSTIRANAVELLYRALPALKDLAGPAVDEVLGQLTVGSVGSFVALVGFGWAASGLYLNLTRAMERFFPGMRVSGVAARIAGVLLVALIIVGILAGVIAGWMLAAIAGALEIDVELLVALASTIVALAAGTGITYAAYRLVPAVPPAAASARLPALLVGTAISLLTLFYSLISAWLTASFQTLGVMAAVFVALAWLRLVFIAMTYGAAMARYRDLVAIARVSGAEQPEAAATADVLRLEAERARLGQQGARAIGALPLDESKE